MSHKVPRRWPTTAAAQPCRWLPDMTRLLIPLLLLLVSVSFVAMRCAALVRDLRVGHMFSSADYIDLLQIPIMLVAAGLAISALRRVRRESRGGTGASLSTDPRAGSSLRVAALRAADVWIVAFTRHPTKATLSAALLLALPVALVALVFGGDVRRWNLKEWLLLGVVQLPILTIAVIAAFRRRSANFRLERP